MLYDLIIKNKKNAPISSSNLTGENTRNFLFFFLFICHISNIIKMEIKKKKKKKTSHKPFYHINLKTYYSFYYNIQTHIFICYLFKYITTHFSF
ncbi:hypothetical protein PFUGPA_02840 [Plasmodium falciparum Palo Alto/Uganda]|uniref:Uncharacterized protein n=1 Tax=Plasmodium falciparum (isolate Palo Alto / Uganda) TaxID=57270 RepID=W4J046_PLAFP|nr:hypothetical protein PFUGPA_02840 [Plasmodium falciparum Palo Alto/Uganda]